MTKRSGTDTGKTHSHHAAVEPQEREKIIRETAYYFAERRGFNGGDPMQDWLAAEAEIDALLAKNFSRSTEDRP